MSKYILRFAIVLTVAGCAHKPVDKPIPANMDSEAIRKTIRDHLREVRQCFESQLKVDPDLEGKIVLEWNIVEDGSVSRVEIKEDFSKPNSASGCIADRLKSWHFPKPAKDRIGRVSYPFMVVQKLL
jgi:hypothetical protein